MIQITLNEAEHQLLRSFLSDAMQQEGTSTDEYEETLNALHTKICLYFVELWLQKADSLLPRWGTETF